MFGRLRVASSHTALALVIAVVSLVVVGVAMSLVGGTTGAGGIWVVLIPFGVFGVVVARRQPSNPIGTILLLLMLLVVASSDAARYTVLRYRDGDHGLPLGRLAAFLAPGTWMWLVVFLPLPLALFPDGRLSQRWRRVFWGYLVVAASFVAVNGWQNASALVARHIQVDSKGQLTSIGSPVSDTAYKVVILLYLGVGGLVWAVRLLLGYRRSKGDYRQQLKWLLSGGALAVIGLLLEYSLGSSNSQVLRAVGNVGLLLGLIAIPVGLGVGILKYRLYDIDRLISRTLSYLIVTGLLGGLFIGIIVLATDVLPFSSPWLSPPPPWRLQRSSTRCASASSDSSTGASTGRATTPKPQCCYSWPSCATQSISTPCETNSSLPSTTPSSPCTPLSGSDHPLNAAACKPRSASRGSSAPRFEEVSDTFKVSDTLPSRRASRSRKRPTDQQVTRRPSGVTHP